VKGQTSQQSVRGDSVVCPLDGDAAAALGDRVEVECVDD